MPRNVKGLFVGLNTIDMQFFVDGFPGRNTKTKAHRNEIACGGPATNASIVFSFLEGEPTLVTPIGKHSLTRFLTDDIIDHGVELIDPISNIDSKPIFASIITDEINGERTIFSYHPEHDHSEVLKELSIPNLSSYDIALFDGFYLELAIPLAKELRTLGIKTVLDGGSWKNGLEELLPHIDIAICSNDFKPPSIQKEPKEIINALKDYGVKDIVITRGEKSILYSEQDTIKEIAIRETKVVDTLGAGDFFHGAFCYYLGGNENISGSLSSAAHVATESCKYHGTRTWMEHFPAVSFRKE